MQAQERYIVEWNIEQEESAERWDSRGQNMGFEGRTSTGNKQLKDDMLDRNVGWKHRQKKTVP